jgi:hypothetical protein
MTPLLADLETILATATYPIPTTVHAAPRPVWEQPTLPPDTGHVLLYPMDRGAQPTGPHTYTHTDTIGILIMTPATSNAHDDLHDAVTRRLLSTQPDYAELTDIAEEPALDLAHLKTQHLQLTHLTATYATYKTTGA